MANKDISMVVKEVVDRLITKVEQDVSESKVGVDDFLGQVGKENFSTVFGPMWKLLYEEAALQKADGLVYVTDEMLQWLGFECDEKHMKAVFMRALETYEIAHKYVATSELCGDYTDRVTNIPDILDGARQHILMTPQNFKIAATVLRTRQSVIIREELINLTSAVIGYVTYERAYSQVQEHVAKQQLKALKCENEYLEENNAVLEEACDELEDENEDLLESNTELETTLDTVVTKLTQANANVEDLSVREAYIPKKNDKMNELTLMDLCHTDSDQRHICKVIRGQKSHTEKEVMRIKEMFPGARRLIKVTDHPNAMSKWHLLKNEAIVSKRIRPTVSPFKSECMDVDYKVSVVCCEWPYTPQLLADLIEKGHPKDGQIVRYYEDSPVETANRKRENILEYLTPTKRLCVKKILE